MCKLCRARIPQNHGGRRDFLKATAASGVAAAAGLELFAARPAAAHDGEDPPEDHGRPSRR